MFYELLTGRKPFIGRQRHGHVHEARPGDVRAAAAIGARHAGLAGHAGLPDDGEETGAAAARRRHGRRRPGQHPGEGRGPAQRRRRAVRRQRCIDRGRGQTNSTRKTRTPPAPADRQGQEKDARRRCRSIRRCWFQAIGVARSCWRIVGHSSICVLRPPSADKLYQQAEKLMESDNAEDREAAPGRPDQQYLDALPGRADEQTETDPGLGRSDRNRRLQRRGLLRQVLQKERARLVYRLVAGRRDAEGRSRRSTRRTTATVDASERIWQQIEQQEATGLWVLVTAKASQRANASS